jgi:Zn-dependent protease
MGDSTSKMQIEDYARYPNESLVVAAVNVNRAKYPYIWHQIKSELERRGLSDPKGSEKSEGSATKQPVTDFVNPEEVLAAIKKLEDTSESNGWQNLLILVGTIFLFGLAQMQMDLGQKVLCIILALLVHEAGHILAMRFCNYKNLRILMIPLFGAVAIGNPTDKSAKKAAIVAISGPLFGLFSAFISMEIYHLTGSAIAREYAVIALVLNMFNLLPIRPFDGGAFLNEIIFCRFPKAQLIFGVLSAILILVPSILQKQVIPIHLFIIWLVYLQTRTGYFFSKTARKIRPNDSKVDDSIGVTHVTTILQEYQQGAPVAFRQLNGMKDKEVRWAKVIQSIWVESKKTYMSSREGLIIVLTCILLVGVFWGGMKFSDHYWRVSKIKSNDNLQALRLNDFEETFSFIKGSDFARLKSEWNEVCSGKKDFHCRLASYLLIVEGHQAEALELQKISCSKDDPHSCYNVFDNELSKEVDKSAASAILDDVCQQESEKSKTCCTCYADAKKRMKGATK